MNITLFDDETQDSPASVYYPHYTTEWLVEFRSIFGKRKEKMTMMTDRMKNGSGIANALPGFVKKEVDASLVMDGKVDEQECIDDAFETVRRFYLHHVRSWSVPKIELTNHTFVYVPYQLVEKNGRWFKKTRTYLYEPMSASSDKVENFPEIHHFIKKEVENV
ncbi:hypothetical protein D7Z54_30585 [Salibacterium salarium]|uniref:Uncharacterized protein n=1 Tax=Salibacterium salarium TaxID=284579 RepID=A0A428MTT9_9BACI|nr:hypothetical protein [Salibacterium salarium]RSL29549.1 hypothetical protein D7Z54_30585 [Salibacterium salarium]